MAEVTTTLVVNFNGGGVGAQSVLTAEIDSRTNGFNGGKTSFGPGDSPVFLVFKTSDVTLTSVVPSTGVIQNVGAGLFAVEQDLQFTDAQGVSLTKPIYGSFQSSKWLGANLGALTLVGQTRAVAANMPGTTPGIARVTYNAQYQAYRIANINYPLNGETEFPVVVLIKGETP